MVDTFLRLPDAIVLVDGAGTIVWGTASAERIFERSLGRLGGPIGPRPRAPRRPRAGPALAHQIQDKEVGSPIEIRVSAAPGGAWSRSSAPPSHWSGQSVVLLCMRDLTERRRYELASGREARFRSLVHNAGSIIMLVSADGTVESVSGAITRLLGHDPELLEQRPLLDIVARPTARKLAAALRPPRTALHGHQPGQGPGRTCCATTAASIVPFELSIVDLLDDPTVEGFVISAHDATVAGVRRARARARPSPS